MFLTVFRYSETPESTLSVLLINGYFECYVLEPPYGKRIPGGDYKLELYKWGEVHKDYLKKFPGIHQGMILIKNVPGKEACLFHTGNWVRHTKACLLTGTTCNNNQLDPGHVISSTAAYLRMYPPVRDALLGPEGARLLIGTPVELLKINPFNNQKNGGKNHV